MREVPDATGRFKMRPHYDLRELDRACERLLGDFFRKDLGSIPVPIVTDDLTRLIEGHVSDFDPGSDLSAYGVDVEGVTEFKPGRKPRVRISAALAYDERRENRYRTTLTHELGHVHFHSYLFELDQRQVKSPRFQVCKRETMIGAPQRDWMEWQAGYVCGALLMPATALRRIVMSFLQDLSPSTKQVTESSRNADDLVQLVKEKFKVSADAARVRLMAFGVIVR